MIHVKTWNGGCSARITDMTNAGKRGKTCRVLSFRGCPWDSWSGDDLQKQSKQVSNNVMHVIEGLLPASPTCDFDTAAGMIEAMIDKARAEGIPESYVAAYRAEIRGVDAPVEKLTASGEGWSASADENGISIDDEKDQCNLPCMITSHKQKDSEAYRLAVKVWDQVKTATSFNNVGDILSAAGCRLHYFCRMD